MNYGFVLPYGDARTAANLAQLAEGAGWDGFYVWDPVWGIDPWVALAAAAMLTGRIRLGTMITPPSRRRPWTLAGQTAALDNLSAGRVVLAVGLGALDTGFTSFGEVTDRKTRAELLDESLDILTGLWRGQPFQYEGKHYHIQPTEFYPPPPPVQQPRIPIWVVASWPQPKSMQRAARYDGLLPSMKKPDGTFAGLTPPDIRAMKGYIDEARSTLGIPAGTPYDIIHEGRTPGSDLQAAAEQLRPWAEAGVTWWIESMWGVDDPQEVRKRIEQGPPAIK
jgi:alkanesulfonate monooxygenase SsuD/methylene tetrahydromethanopterin reductase-like flavin-dependent oxidoreductase (luciferase family)